LDPPNKYDLERRSYTKAKVLLGMADPEQLDEATRKELLIYGLGSQRSLQDFEAHTGVCFRTKQIQPHAFHAKLSPQDFVPSNDTLVASILQLLNLPTTTTTTTTTATSNP
jgi:hypothetical protein